MGTVHDYGQWKLDIEPFPVAGMFTANATITRVSTRDDVRYFRYRFRNLGVSGTEHGAAKWAAEWLRTWIDDNA